MAVVGSSGGLVSIGSCLFLFQFVAQVCWDYVMGVCVWVSPSSAYILVHQMETVLSNQSENLFYSISGSVK